MFCNKDDLHNEADVEQKLLWHVLTSASPRGLGFSPADVLTKPNIRGLEIGKRASLRVFYPDYLVVLAGLPVLVVEAKPPADGVETALEEARMYAARLNERFPAGTNPCGRVIVSNGLQIVSTSWDSAEPDLRLDFESIVVGHLEYAKFCDLLGRATVKHYSDTILRKLASHPLHRAILKVGGISVRNEEIGHSTFGSTLALEYRHIFSPSTLEDRAYLVRNAYVRSRRRDHFIEPIDRLIREIVPPGITHIPEVQELAEPREVVTALGKGRSLEHQIMLLVGSAGSGKSTFIDHLVNVALPQDLLDSTVWLRLDMNTAPVDKSLAHDWLLRRIADEFRATEPKTDFEHIDTLRKVYGPELNKLRKGPLALLKPESDEYNVRLTDHLIALQNDKLATAKALSRHLAGERRKLAVIVLDNCDKRALEEQLLMFELASWTQSELRCLVVLPLRDITYDHFRHKPPLDTAQKDLVFRIEPPQFTEVLSSRVALALKEMNEKSPDAQLSYSLSNGFKVLYPRSDQGMYLACILKSLYEHDRLLKRTLVGLAGRDVRRALEMFVEFCTSGYIDEGQILAIRKLHGNYVLPLNVVSQVLLRMNRRYYDGEVSYLKNIFQCAPEDPLPDHFVRLAILRFLDARSRDKATTGYRGFQRCGDIIQRLGILGHAAERVRAELLYLASAGCIIAEHQRTDALADEDLVSLTSSGSVHLQMLQNVDYLAACAEDTWVNEERLATQVSDRIKRDARLHADPVTAYQNASEFVAYLGKQAPKMPGAVGGAAGFLADGMVEEVHGLAEAHFALESAKALRTRVMKEGRLFVRGLAPTCTEADVSDVFRTRGFDVAEVFFPLLDGQKRGFCYVRLVDPNATERALAAVNGARCLGRRVFLELPRERPRAPMPA